MVYGFYVPIKNIEIIHDHKLISNIKTIFQIQNKTEIQLARKTFKPLKLAIRFLFECDYNIDLKAVLYKVLVKFFYENFIKFEQMYFYLTTQKYKPLINSKDILTQHEFFTLFLKFYEKINIDISFTIFNILEAWYKYDKTLANFPVEFLNVIDKWTLDFFIYNWDNNNCLNEYIDLLNFLVVYRQDFRNIPEIELLLL